MANDAFNKMVSSTFQNTNPHGLEDPVPVTPSNKLYRILSIDGGGVRGLMVVRLLQRIEHANPGWLNSIDLFAGTSTGAIICLALAAGLSLDDLFNLYYNKSSYLFSRPFAIFRWLNLWKAKYNNKHMRNILENAFGDKKLIDLPRKVIVPAFDLDGQDTNGHRIYKPKFFHNLDGDADRQITLTNLAMASVAAPTFFPSVAGYVDGGIIANNPSVAALAQTLDPTARPNPSVSNIRLLSIGTGKGDTFYPGSRLDWGLIQWGTRIIETMMNGMVDVADYQCQQFLRENYIRLNPSYPDSIPFDDPSQRDKLVETADNADIWPIITWLNRIPV